MFPFWGPTVPFPDRRSGGAWAPPAGRRHPSPLLCHCSAPNMATANRDQSKISTGKGVVGQEFSKEQIHHGMPSFTTCMEHPTGSQPI